MKRNGLTCHVVTNRAGQCRRKAVWVAQLRKGEGWGSGIPCCWQHVQRFVNPDDLDASRVYFADEWQREEARP
jgi:hypothetical protein